LIRCEFDPVAEELHLSGPVLEKENMYFTHGYFGDPLGLEVDVDLSPFFVFALVFRDGSGSSMPVGYVDSSGTRQIRYIQEAMEILRLPYEAEDAELKRLGGNWDNCQAMVSILAQLVRRSWSQLCTNSDKLFPGLG
jgi:hypothetical protein